MSMGPADYRRMQLNPATTPQSRHSALRHQGSTYGSPEASAEIYAYIAARNLALVSAERAPSEMSLNRAFLANELVGNCLKPARSPYEAQSLSEVEAMHERSRHTAVMNRIAQLRACLSVAA